MLISQFYKQQHKSERKHWKGDKGEKRKTSKKKKKELTFTSVG